MPGINACNYLLEEISKNNRCVRSMYRKMFLNGIQIVLLKMGFKKEGYYGL